MGVPELLVGAGGEPVGQRRDGSVAGQVDMQGGGQGDRSEPLMDGDVGDVGDVLVGGAVHGRAGVYWLWVVSQSASVGMVVWLVKSACKGAVKVIAASPLWTAMLAMFLLAELCMGVPEFIGCGW